MKNDRKNFESNPSVQWCNEQRKNDHIPLKTTRTNAICAKISLWPTTKTDSSIFSRELVCGVRLALVLRAVEKKKKVPKNRSGVSSVFHHTNKGERTSPLIRYSATLLKHAVLSLTRQQRRGCRSSHGKTIAQTGMVSTIFVSVLSTHDCCCLWITFGIVS